MCNAEWSMGPCATGPRVVEGPLDCRLFCSDARRSYYAPSLPNAARPEFPSTQWNTQGPLRLLKHFASRSAYSAQDDSPPAAPSLPAHHRLRRPHVVVTVVHSHHHHMLGASRPLFSGLGRDLEVVLLTLRIGQLPDGLNVFPISGIHRVLRPLDGRVSVPGTEVHVNLTILHRRRQIFDPRRSRIHLKPAA